MKKLTVTIDEAANALGIGRNSAYAAARTGELPTVRVGKRLLVPIAALETMLSKPKGKDAAIPSSTSSRLAFELSQVAEEPSGSWWPR
jgi:excisionase family DNA binding protein